MNAFCFGVMTSQDVHFRGSLPPNDCVSLHKIYLGCIVHILGYIDAKFDGQNRLLRVDMTAQPCETELITVHFCMQETAPQNGVEWLLPKVTCPPSYILTWI